MLVLTRKLQQQIKIGDQITVTILRVKGSTVRIGVQAPREVRVIRGELPKGDSGPAEANNPTPETSLVLCTQDIETQEITTIENSAPQIESNAADVEVEASAVRAAAHLPTASAELPKTAHLPLRKIRNRRGAGPLKQMVASCAALAK